MTVRLMSLAPLVLGTPFLLAQQANPQGNTPPQGAPPAAQGHMHGRADHPRGTADRGSSDRRMDQHEEMRQERMDLDDLGLPTGSFWLDPEVVALANLTPDQVHRLSDAYLQATLKLIQLDADLQMDQARLEPMLSATPMDPNATLAQIDRIAEEKAAIDKADARLAFALRAVLTPDQLTKLHSGMVPRPMPMGGFGMGDQPAPPPQM